MIKHVLHFFKAMVSGRGQWLFQNKPIVPIIVVGIEYASHRFASLLQTLNKHHSVQYQIMAFVDDNPWHKKVELFSAKVHPESDVLSLVRKHAVAIIVELEGERLTLSDAVWQAIRSLPAKDGSCIKLALKKHSLEDLVALQQALEGVEKT